MEFTLIGHVGVEVHRGVVLEQLYELFLACTLSVRSNYCNIPTCFLHEANGELAVFVIPVFFKEGCNDLTKGLQVFCEDVPVFYEDVLVFYERYAGLL